MLQLHYANRLENVIEPLAQTVEEQQRHDPLESIVIIVPNRAVEQFVKYRIAEQLGVAANLKFPFLRKYLGEVVERADPRVRVLEVPRLQVAIFEFLRSDAHSADADFKPLRDYVAAASAANAAIAELRLFELAGLMARLFHEYAISRDTMLRVWAAPLRRGEVVSETERWQRRLWAAVFDEHRVAHEKWLGDCDHRWMLLPHAAAAVDDAALRIELPATIHVFGLASPGRAFLEIFSRLGRLTELRIYALNPCMEFWEDVDTSAANRAEWRRRTERVGAHLEEQEDPFELAAPSDTRALQLWGRPGREYIRMLNELTDCDFHPKFSHSAGGSLLTRLQEDILTRSVEGEESPGDTSGIRFLGAPGVRREIEIVANEILRIADSRPLSAAPAFYEMAVMVPDGLAETYLPQIESIFTSQFGIPVEVVGGARLESGTAEAIDLLLKLPLGRLTRDEMLRLLAHPSIAGADHEIDRDRFSAWCEELGVFFGADASDLANTYVPSNLFHWDQALTRVALGVFMEGDSNEEGALYEDDGGELLPLDLPQEDLAGAARFLKVARSLIADAVALRALKLPLAEWAGLIGELVGRYIGAVDSVDEAVRERYLGALEPMGAVLSEPVGYEVAHAFASGAMAEFGGGRKGLSGRGVAAGSLTTLRALPFRAIFVMGLGEALFPERDRRDPLDLRLARRHPGDISAPERDRYLFLEAILAARDQITFSWVERDPNTGDNLQPSTTLRELQAILRSYLDEETVKRLTISHPVSQYDSDYFTSLRVSDDGQSVRVSYDPDAHRGARMVAMREDLLRATSGAVLPARGQLIEYLNPGLRERIAGSLGLFEQPPRSAAETDAIDLPLAAIRRFLECPLQGAARYALGMVRDDELPEEAIDEPIVQTRLNHAILLRDAFWAARGDLAKFESEYRTGLQLAQMQGRAPAGPFADAAITADGHRFGSWMQMLAANGIGNLDAWRQIRIGRGDEFASADLELPAVELEIAINSVDGPKGVRRVKLYGSLGRFSPDFDKSLRLVTRANSKPQDFLELIIAAIALRATQGPMAEMFRAVVLGDPRDKQSGIWIREYRLPSPEVAREYLASLVTEMMTRTHDYFLPIDAIAKVRSALANGGDPIQEIENVRERPGWVSCASDFGPVRQPRDYDPPDEDELAAIVQHRFEPIAVIFDGKDA